MTRFTGPGIRDAARYRRSQPAWWIARLLGLLAVLTSAGPAHAQGCSGGKGGGMDASGNQCSEPNAVGSYADVSDIALPLPAAKMSGIQQSTGATAKTRPTAKMAGSPAASAGSAQAVSRFAKAASPPSAPVKTSKIEAVDAGSSCSGGVNGGMDATGNQCAEMDTGSVVAARR